MPLHPHRLSLTATLILAGCSQPAPLGIDAAPLTLETMSEVPLQHPSSPIVHVSITNAQGKVTEDVAMLLDSGSTTTILSEEACVRAGLQSGDYEKASTGRDSSDSEVLLARYAWLPSLRMGDLELRDTYLSLVDSPAFEVQGIDGIIGQDLLTRVIWLCDAGRGRIQLLPVGTDIQGHLSQDESFGGAWKCGELDFRPTPYFPLRVRDNDELELLIDTGSTNTSFPAVAIDAMGLEPIGTTERYGLGSNYQTEEYELEDFDLYGLKVSLTVHRSQLDHGLLGMDILSELVFLLDGSNRQIWLYHRGSR